jgi:hypothetical protein
MPQKTPERRVSELEAKVTKLAKSSRKSVRWWMTDAGRFVNDPVFDEIVELGRDYRLSLGPKRRKGIQRDNAK